MTDHHRHSQPSADPTESAFATYSGDLHRFLTRRMHCSQTARDLAQDVYLRFMLVSRREVIRNVQAFLYQLASNLIYEFRAREQHSQVVFDSDLVEAADRQSALEMEADPSDRLADQDELRRLLAPLPPVYRAVLLMRKRDGLSPDEIAQRLGYSKKTVYEYLTRAMALIKEQERNR